jgi:hypothetical protein
MDGVDRATASRFPASNGSRDGRPWRPGVQMIPSRWTIGCLALAAFASGCSHDPDAGRKLYPVLNERGLITYTYEEPEASVSSGSTREQAPQFEATQAWPDPQSLEQQNLEFERRLAALHKSRIEQERRDRQAAEARELAEAQRAKLRQEEFEWRQQLPQGTRDIMRQQEERLRGRTESPASGYAQAGRRRDLRSRNQADMDRLQLQNTSDYLRAEGERLRQEARRLRPVGPGDSGIDYVPVPVTGP